ncbi:MAG: NTP transferase domain-containing protein [Gammaproteobacteria bacterium]|nr:NTP transferase domain-containing protein [Gammaproteobacteria bacterium]
MDPWLPHPQSVTALILALDDGRSGADDVSAAVDWAPELARTSAYLKRRCGTVIVATTGDPAACRGFGRVVVPQRGREPSPLACVESGMLASSTPWLLFMPAGLPEAPEEVLADLLRTLRSQPPMRLAIPTDGERVQPWLCAIRRTTLPDLGRFLDAGGTDIFAWLDLTPHALVQVP